MNEDQRLQLQNMINANNTEDYTELIRELKHSEIIRNDVKNLMFLKTKYSNDQEKIHFDAASECSFIFNYYTDIYNKIRKDELDTETLDKFLDVLKKIENGELNQHDGSFIVGTMLKKMYVDSALRKADKLNEGEITNEPKKADKQISWAEYKKML